MPRNTFYNFEWRSSINWTPVQTVTVSPRVEPVFMFKIGDHVKVIAGTDEYTIVEVRWDTSSNSEQVQVKSRSTGNILNSWFSRTYFELVSFGMKKNKRYRDREYIQ